jgi:hypothetical protein
MSAVPREPELLRRAVLAGATLEDAHEAGIAIARTEGLEAEYRDGTVYVNTSETDGGLLVELLRP